MVKKKIRSKITVTFSINSNIFGKTTSGPDLQFWMIFPLMSSYIYTSVDMYMYTKRGRICHLIIFQAPMRGDAATGAEFVDSRANSFCEGNVHEMR